MRNVLLIIVGAAVAIASGTGLAGLLHPGLRTQLAWAMTSSEPTTVITLEVDSEALRSDALEAVAERMAAALRDATPAIAVTGRGVQDDAARVRLANPGDMDAARKAIASLEVGPDYSEPLVLSAAEDGVIEARFTPADVSQLISRASQQGGEVLSRRINPSGALPVTIAIEGDNRIVVRMRGATDPALVRQAIAQGLLTFHLVHETPNADTDMPPAGTMRAEAYPGLNTYGPEIVARRPLLTGANLVSADPQPDQTGRYAVAFRFDLNGARRFCAITREHTSERFAILLDGKVVSAPNILEPICGGSAQISGNFTRESAQDLAILLRAGALPAPIRIVSEHVEP